MVEVEGCNRYLVVDIIEDAEKEENSLVLLPDEYEQPKGMYAVGKIKKSATWNTLEWTEGQIVAFPRSVIQEVTFRGETAYLVQENYIICTLGDS